MNIRGHSVCHKQMSIVISLRRGSAEGTKVALDNIENVKEF